MSDTTNYSDFEKDLENEAYWKAVFGPTNEPQREFKAGTRHTTLLGWFPTRKCIRGEVRTREPLMGDLLFHLDTDPAIRVIAEFPIKQLYDARKSDGTPIVKEHIPDLGVLRADGAVFVIDVMPYYVRKSIRGMDERSAILRRHYVKLGATYLLLDETTIRLEPLFSNLRLMWKHKHSKHEPSGMAQLRDALREASYPASIETLMRTMPHNAIFARWSDEPSSAARHVVECNPTFSAVMQLAIAGELDVDLNSKFSSKTIVTRKESAHV